MVNHLRLSQLATEPAVPAGPGPQLFAAVSFSVLALLFFAGLGLQYFGDPDGGTPAVSLALNGVPEDSTHGPMVLDPLPQDGNTQVSPVLAQEDIRVVTADDAEDELAAAGAPVATIHVGSHTPLPAAPVAALTETTEFGALPIVGANGDRPADVYARPYSNPADLPRVALVIGGLGINEEATRTAIETLPGEVTLSFVPYAENLQGWIDLARQNGHEVILELPLEPFDYPTNDPGPATILTSSTPDENARRLDWVLGRAGGYVGLMNYQGARLTASERSYAPVLQEIADRGLLFLDDGTSPRSMTRRISAGTGGEWAVASRRIDLRRNGAAINSALQHLETAAQADGVAIGVGFAYPVTVEQIMTWVSTLELKGFSLAPLSAATASEMGE